jgi:hypothetical protein
MQAAEIHKLLECRTHFYNIFISEVNHIICGISVEKGCIYIDELVMSLVSNLRDMITEECMCLLDLWSWKSCMAREWTSDSASDDSITSSDF